MSFETILRLNQLKASLMPKTSASSGDALPRVHFDNAWTNWAAWSRTTITWLWRDGSSNKAASTFTLTLFIGGGHHCSRPSSGVIKLKEKSKFLSWAAFQWSRKTTLHELIQRHHLLVVSGLYHYDFSIRTSIMLLCCRCPSYYFDQKLAEAIQQNYESLLLLEQSGIQSFAKLQVTKVWDWFITWVANWTRRINWNTLTL